MNDWDFDDLLNLDWHLLDDLNDLFDDDLNRFDNLLPHQLLPDHFHLPDLYFFVYNLDNLLNMFGHFHNALNCPDDWHYLLHDTVDRLVDGLDMVADL
jgi:hypothetical protein